MSELSRWVALRELRFAVAGEQVVVPAGERVPAKCWATCDARRLARLRDPYSRLVVEAHDAA